MSHDVFISHASTDKTAAQALCSTLEAKGIRCWIAPRDIKPGENWAAAIVHGIANSRIMVLVFSSHSNVSDHVRREVERAAHRGMTIVPVRIQDFIPTEALEYFLSSSHWIDAITPPFEQHAAFLAQSIQALVSATTGNTETISLVDAVEAQLKESCAHGEARSGSASFQKPAMFTFLRRRMRNVLFAVAAVTIVITVVIVAIHKPPYKEPLRTLDQLNSDVAAAKTAEERHKASLRTLDQSTPLKAYHSFFDALYQGDLVGLRSTGTGTELEFATLDELSRAFFTYSRVREIAVRKFGSAITVQDLTDGANEQVKDVDVKIAGETAILVSKNWPAEIHVVRAGALWKVNVNFIVELYAPLKCGEVIKAGDRVYRAIEADEYKTPDDVNSAIINAFGCLVGGKY